MEDLGFNLQDNNNNNKNLLKILLRILILVLIIFLIIFIFIKIIRLFTKDSSNNEIKTIKSTVSIIKIKPKTNNINDIFMIEDNQVPSIKKTIQNDNFNYDNSNYLDQSILNKKID